MARWTIPFLIPLLACNLTQTLQGPADAGAPGNDASARPDTQGRADAGAPGSDASARPDTGARSSSDATPDTKGSDAATDGGGQVSPPASGTVEIFPTGSEPGTLAVMATFQAITDAGASPCQSRTAGTCTVTVCPHPAPPPPPVQLLSAGNLIVDSITIAPGPDAGYTYGGVGVGPVWAAGQSIHVRATGGAVPAFEGDIVAPPLLTVITPPGILGGNMGLNANFSLSKSTAIPLAWTAAAAPTQVLVNIEQAWFGPLTLGQGPSYQGVIINCTFDASVGSGTIPAAALTDLVTGYDQSQGGPSTAMSLSSATQVTLPAGDDTVILFGNNASAQFNIPLSTGVTP